VINDKGIPKPIIIIPSNRVLNRGKAEIQSWFHRPITATSIIFECYCKNYDITTVQESTLILYKSPNPKKINVGFFLSNHQTHRKAR
jgi:hypothetical protein